MNDIAPKPDNDIALYAAKKQALENYAFTAQSVSVVIDSMLALAGAAIGGWIGKAKGNFWKGAAIGGFVSIASSALISSVGMIKGLSKSKEEETLLTLGLTEEQATVRDSQILKQIKQTPDASIFYDNSTRHFIGIGEGTHYQDKLAENSSSQLLTR